jgi:acetoacetyl-CoA synthetase
MIEVPDLPYTMSGKKMEVPLRKFLMGRPLHEVMSADSMRNPDVLPWYEALVQTRGGNFARA